MPSGVCYRVYLASLKGCLDAIQCMSESVSSMPNRMLRYFLGYVRKCNFLLNSMYNAI